MRIYPDHADYLADKWQREADEADDAAEGLPNDEERRMERAEYLAELRRDREADSQ